MRPFLFAAIVVAGATVAVAQPAGVQPGMWETSSTVESIDMPGAPPGIAAMMKGRTTVVKHCMTPEEAAGGPQAAMRSDKSCTFPRYTVGGGRFESEMVCTRGGTTTTATGSGTYGATTFTGRSKVVGNGPMPMTLVATVTGHRTGDCR